MDENPYLAPDRSDNTRQPPPIEATPRSSRSMRPADLFEVAVRVLGLAFIGWGAVTMFGILLPADGYAAFDYLLGAVGYMSIGIVYFLFAKVLVAMAYGGRDRYAEFD